MEIINCTAHDLNLYRAEDAVSDPVARKLILKPGAQCIATYPKSDVRFDADVKERLIASINIDGISIPIVHKQWTCYEESLTYLRELGDEGHVIVVSGIFKTALSQLELDVELPTAYTVAGLVYTNPSDKVPAGFTKFGC